VTIHLLASSRIVPSPWVFDSLSWLYTTEATERHSGAWQGVEPEEYIQFLNLTLWDTYQILANLPPLPPAAGDSEASDVKRAAAEVAEELRALGLGGNATGMDQGEVELELQGEAASEEEAAVVQPQPQLDAGRPHHT
jgi:hypothetical protein